MTNKYERARSPVVNRVHNFPVDDLHNEQKRLDKLHDVFRKSDTVDNHTTHLFGGGKAKPPPRDAFVKENDSTSTEEEKSSQAAAVKTDQ